MKINGSAGLEQYKNYVQKLKKDEAAAAKTPVGAKAAGPNTDKVTLSGEAAARAELSRAVTVMSAEVDAPADAARMEALRAKVADGSYYVASDDLANAILGLDTRG